MKIQPFSSTTTFASTPIMRDWCACHSRQNKACSIFPIVTLLSVLSKSTPLVIEDALSALAGKFFVPVSITCLDDAEIMSNQCLHDFSSNLTTKAQIMGAKTCSSSPKVREGCLTAAVFFSARTPTCNKRGLLLVQNSPHGETMDASRGHRPVVRGGV